MEGKGSEERKGGRGGVLRKGREGRGGVRRKGGRGGVLRKGREGEEESRVSHL